MAKKLKLVAAGVGLDSKNRISLGRAVAGLEEDVRFDVFITEDGDRIVLEAKVSIPASEAWLYRNREAIAAVRKGLQQAAEGKTVKLGSFARYAEADES